MNKIALIFILFSTQFLYLECMKRPADQFWEVETNSRTKPRIGYNLQNSIQPRIQDHKLHLDQLYQRLFFLEEELKKTKIQILHIDAIQNKNINTLWYSLAHGPKRSCLDFAVRSHFTEGIELILKHTEPTPDELHTSLCIAIASQNAYLTKLLLENRAILNTNKKPLHPLVENILGTNTQIINLVAQSSKLSDIVKMGLKEVLIRMLKIRKFQQEELNEALYHSAIQQNELFATILIEAGANIDSSIH